MDAAIEVKGSVRAHEGHLGGLRACADEHKVRHSILVSLDRQERVVDRNIRIMPWRKFLDALWNQEIA